MRREWLIANLRVRCTKLVKRFSASLHLVSAAYRASLKPPQFGFVRLDSVVKAHKLFLASTPEASYWPSPLRKLGFRTSRGGRFIADTGVAGSKSILRVDAIRNISPGEALALLYIDQDVPSSLVESLGNYRFRVDDEIYHFPYRGVVLRRVDENLSHQK